MTGERYSLNADVVFYALDRTAGQKHRIAVDLWRAMRFGPAMLSVQTLCETYWAVQRKRPDQLEVARRLLTLAAERVPVVAARSADFLEVCATDAERPVHFWDALLASTLRRHGCRVLLTEDLQDRPAEDGLRRLNPFTAAAEVLARFLPG